MALVEQLDSLPRAELIEKAREAGVQRPELMTRVELKDEIIRRTETDEVQRRRTRGFLGVARDLLASVVEQGLHMPDAAALIRGDVRIEANAPPPVATVTLAEIYAAQGHVDRSLRMLDEVIEREPDHDVARKLRERLLSDAQNLAAKKRRAPAELRMEFGQTGGESDDGVGAAAAASEGDAKAAEEARAGATPAVLEAEPTLEPAPAVSIAAERAEAAEPGDVAAGGCVYLVSGGPGKWCLYWELSHATQDRLAKEHPGCRPVIRIAKVTPQRAGAAKHEQDFEIQGIRGQFLMDDPGAKTRVRAALGVVTEQALLPIAVAKTLRVTNEGSYRSAFDPRPLAEPQREAEERAMSAFRAQAQ